MHRLVGDEDVELVRIEDQFVGAAAVERLPEIEHVVGGLLVDVDHAGMVLAAIADQAVIAGALEVDRQRDAAARDVRRFAGDQRFRRMQVEQFALAEQRLADAESGSATGASLAER